jgi:hypothetical protein
MRHKVKELICLEPRPDEFVESAKKGGFPPDKIRCGEFDK